MSEEDRLSEAGAVTSQHGGSKAKPKKAKEPFKEPAETARNTALVDEVFRCLKSTYHRNSKRKANNIRLKLLLRNKQHNSNSKAIESNLNLTLKWMNS